MTDQQPPTPGGFPEPSFTPPPGPRAPQTGGAGGIQSGTFPVAGQAPATTPSTGRQDAGGPDGGSPYAANPYAGHDAGDPNARGQRSASPPRRFSAKPLTILIGLAAVALVLVVIKATSGGSSSSTAALPEGWYGAPPPAVPGAEPSEAWTARFDGFVSDVAIHDDRVFVLETGEEPLLTAYDRDGDEVWAEEVDLGYEGVQVLDGHLLLGSGGEATETTALDIDTGERLWRSDATPLARSGDHWLAGSYDGQSELHLIDLDDGEELWTVDGSFAGTCGDLVLASGDDEIRAVERSTGDEVWSGDGFDADCSDGVVVTVEDERVTAFALDDGEELWSERGATVTTAADGVAYLHRSGSEETVAVRIHDGEEIWNADGQFYQVPIRGRIVGYDGGRSTVFSVEDGEQLGRAGSDESLSWTSDGFLGVEHTESAVIVTAYDEDLDERWSTSIDGSWVEAGAGMVIGVEDDRITVFR